MPVLVRIGSTGNACLSVFCGRRRISWMEFFGATAAVCTQIILPESALFSWIVGQTNSFIHIYSRSTEKWTWSCLTRVVTVALHQRGSLLILLSAQRTRFPSAAAATAISTVTECKRHLRGVAQLAADGITCSSRRLLLWFSEYSPLINPTAFRLLKCFSAGRYYVAEGVEDDDDEDDCCFNQNKWDWMISWTSVLSVGLRPLSIKCPLRVRRIII